VAYEWLLPLAPWESAAVLERALASLHHQSWPARRLVVSVDGALPEALAEVLRAAALPVLILEAPEWRGAGPALAAGLQACECDWVLRADADDTSHPERAERQLRHLLQQGHLAVLGCQLREANPAGQPAGVRRVPTNSQEIRALMRWRNPLNHPTVALRRQAVLAAGNYRSALGFEDWDLWLRLARRGEELANLPDALVTARVDEAHLARRRGQAYAKRELGFLLRCGRAGLLPPGQVLLLLFARLPWRLVPASWLAALMAGLRSAR
jgi:glycosyltransferase involved in cell wall biosynthesis